MNKIIEKMGNTDICSCGKCSHSKYCKYTERYACWNCITIKPERYPRDDNDQNRG